jgi:hypothetical protein
MEAAAAVYPFRLPTANDGGSPASPLMTDGKAPLRLVQC